MGSVWPQFVEMGIVAEEAIPAATLATKVRSAVVEAGSQIECLRTGKNLTVGAHAVFGGHRRAARFAWRRPSPSRVNIVASEDCTVRATINDRWKHDGVRVINGDQLDANTPQTGMFRQAAINHARVGAQKIWAGTVSIAPDACAKAVGRATSVRRGGRFRRLPLRTALRAASGDQRRSESDARMRARPLG
jgi:hypothetical protein